MDGSTAGLSGIKAVLLDIEGTVCPISFVKDVLFPYALQALPSVLATKWDDPSFTPYRLAFPADHRQTPQALESHVRDLMSRDVKISYLKSLQGYLWETGYRDGELKSPLFGDVPGKLKQWKIAEGKEIVIYSSGSVAAQKLLFRYTDCDLVLPAVTGDQRGGGGTEGGGGHAGKGDLTPLISDYFDTINAGPKMEAASYEKIASQHADRFAIGEWLFLSDNPKEVEAAIKAGMKSYIVQRPGNHDLPDGTADKYRVIESFDEL